MAHTQIGASVRDREFCSRKVKANNQHSVTSSIIVASVYGYLKKPMKTMYVFTDQNFFAPAHPHVAGPPVNTLLTLFMLMTSLGLHGHVQNG
jgi:hypothetical protein